MGWTSPEVVVDVTKDVDLMPPKPLLHPDVLFLINELAHWKVFLLGFGKSTPRDCWSPEKPLRGLPEYKNSWLRNLIETYREEGVREEEMEKAFTYYTLNELKEIDLDEPVGIPDNPDKWSDYSYCLDLEMKVEGEWRHCSLNGLRVETLEEAVESDTPTQISIKDEKFAREETLVDKTGGETLLRASPRAKRYYGQGFPEFVNLLSEIHENKTFDLKYGHHSTDVSEDDIRLIISFTISPSLKTSHSTSNSTARQCIPIFLQ
jgi:hypothetical protein